MLITRCPHCSTTFRVRPEQLTLRGGRVRCGHCHVAFSALNSLEELADDEAEIVLAPSRPAPAPTPVTAAKLDAPAPPAQSPVTPQPQANSAVPPAYTPAAPQPAASVSPQPGAEPAVAPATEPAHQQTARPAPPQAQPPQAAVPSYTPTENFPAAIEQAAASGHSPSVFAEQPQRLAVQPEPAVAPTPPAPLPIETPAPAPLSLEPQTPAADDTAAPVAPEWDIPDFDLDLQPDASIKIEPIEAGLDESDFEPPPPAPSRPTEPRTYGERMPTEPAQARGAPSEEWEADEEIAIDSRAPGSEPFTEFAKPQPEPLFEIEEEDIEASLARQRMEQHTVFLDTEIKVPAKRKAGRGRWWLACAVLLIVAAAQGALAFRMELAKAYPQARPWLEQACAALGCTVPFPRDANAIAVESTDLNPEDNRNGRYRLVATLSNKAAYPQTWPNLELTLTDRFDRALSRRVLTPREWLPAEYAQQPAFEARGEITANVSIATDLPAAGYRLYAFYP